MEFKRLLDAHKEYMRRLRVVQRLVKRYPEGLARRPFLSTLPRRTP